MLQLRFEKLGGVKVIFYYNLTFVLSNRLNTVVLIYILNGYLHSKSY